MINELNGFFTLMIYIYKSILNKLYHLKLALQCDQVE